MNIFLSEITGSCLLILLGNGVVANVVLAKTKGQGAGWIVITFGWAIAVFVGVYVAAAGSGAHLNPAVTIALAIKENIWNNVHIYFAGQMTGAMVGASLVWVQYRRHFDETENADLKLAVFCTAPAIRNIFSNLVSEIIGTFTLILGVLFISTPQTTLGSLGGTTGYAINPARDLGPRIMHAVLPIKGKRDSDWSYSWIPVIGPIIGAILATIVFRFTSGG